MRYEEPPGDMTYKEIMDNINDFCKKFKGCCCYKG